MSRIMITDLSVSAELNSEERRQLHGGTQLYEFPGAYAQRFDGVDQAKARATPLITEGRDWTSNTLS